MKPAGWLCAILWSGLPLAFAAAAQPLVYVVRHAEILADGRDPSLSPDGEARAARLAQMLAPAAIKTIYTSEYRRTRQTAAPVARAMRLAPVVVAARDTPELLRQIAAHGAEAAVLVVGHGNTVPAILKGLGQADDVRLDETDYANLYVLVPKTHGAATLVQLKY